MKTIEIISQDVFDKVRSRFSNLQMGDETGAVTMDPRQARFYDFDFTVEGHNYGRVSVSINELGTLKVFYGQSILEDVDDEGKEYWFDFLKEMRMFAMRRLLRFDTRDITKNNLDKDDFQYLATNGSKEENMNVSESVKFEGSSKTSYGKLKKAKVIVKHKKQVSETPGARKQAKNISAIFVENEEGERFKYPFIHTAGAIAMAQHVAHGGRPYDEQGNAIIGMSEQISQLISCTRHMGLHDSMNQEAHQIAERIHGKLDQLRGTIKSLGGANGYRAWSESFEPTAAMEGDLDEATVESYKNTFTQKNFKEDLAQYFPLIHSVMKEMGEINLEDYVQEASEAECNECGMIESQCGCDEVKESDMDQFENWAHSLAEGQLDDQQIEQLNQLIGQHTMLGADGAIAIAALADIGINDPELSELIQQAAENPNAKLEDVLQIWLPQADPNAAEKMQIDQQAPAPQLPAPDAQQAPEEEPVAEGPNKSDVPAYLRKQQGQAPLTKQELDAEPEKNISHPKALAKNSGREDAMVDKDHDNEKPSLKELAQWVGAFYNKDFQEAGFDSPWRKGVTELATMAEKQFGHPYGHLVEKMVSEFSETALERISREGSLRNAEKDEADDMNAGGGSNSVASPLSQVSNPHLPKGPEDEQFEAILRLAGLAK